MIMPTKPNSPPNSRMENRTPKLDTPVVLPRIFGPRILPSNCWSTIIKIMKYSILIGLTSRMSTAHGTAPINGPKNGMMLVKPMTTARIGTYGIFMIERHTPLIRPIMAESTIFPPKNPPNALSAKRIFSIITLPTLTPNTAYTVFLATLANLVLFARI